MDSANVRRSRGYRPGWLPPRRAWLVGPVVLPVARPVVYCVDLRVAADGGIIVQLELSEPLPGLLLAQPHQHYRKQLLEARHMNHAPIVRSAAHGAHVRESVHAPAHGVHVVECVSFACIYSFVFQFQSVY